MFFDILEKENHTSYIHMALDNTKSKLIILLRQSKYEIQILIQPWPTHVGSRAKFFKNRHVESQNLGFF